MLTLQCRPSTMKASIAPAVVLNMSSPKRVRFPTETDVAIDIDSSDIDSLASSSASSSAPLEVSLLWYNTTEICEFRRESYAQSRQMRDILQHHPHLLASLSSSIAMHNSMLLAIDGDTRGLERRCCSIRQRKRLVANSMILKAAQKFDVAKLAIVAQKCTAWAASLAVAEGQRDCERAWGSSIIPNTGTTDATAHRSSSAPNLATNKTIATVPTMSKCHSSASTPSLLLPAASIFAPKTNTDLIQSMPQPPIIAKKRLLSPLPTFPLHDSSNLSIVAFAAAATTSLLTPQPSPKRMRMAFKKSQTCI